VVHHPGLERLDRLGRSRRLGHSAFPAIGPLT